MNKSAKTPRAPGRPAAAATVQREQLLSIATDLFAQQGIQATRLRAIAAGDGELAELAFIAHSVKGSAGALKLTAIHELAAATDQAAHASHETARQLATELAAQLDLLIPELEARTAAAGPSGALREPPKPLQ